MKIVSAKTFVVGTPAPHDGGAFWVFVKLTTDSGVEGIGEVYAVPFHPAVVEKMIDDVYTELGENETYDLVIPPPIIEKSTGEIRKEVHR